MCWSNQGTGRTMVGCSSRSTQNAPCFPPTGLAAPNSKEGQDMWILVNTQHNATMILSVARSPINVSGRWEMFIKCASPFSPHWTFSNKIKPRDFTLAVPSAWNSLPSHSPPTHFITLFRSLLKCHSFQEAMSIYPIWKTSPVTLYPLTLLPTFVPSFVHLSLLDIILYSYLFMLSLPWPEYKLREDRSFVSFTAALPAPITVCST